MYFFWYSATESYFLFLFLLTSSPAFKRLGDTCSTCWNGCCLYRDQNNWKPDKCLIEEILPSKQLLETEITLQTRKWWWVRLTWFITLWASTRETWVCFVQSRTWLPKVSLNLNYSMILWLYELEIQFKTSFKKNQTTLHFQIFFLSDFTLWKKPQPHVNQNILKYY